MPPNRFESEVESFLEGSHGDRTHIKRADHPRLHHYAGRYSKFAQRSKNGPKLAVCGLLGEFCTGLTQECPVLGEFCTGLARKVASGDSYGPVGTRKDAYLAVVVPGVTRTEAGRTTVVPPQPPPTSRAPALRERGKPATASCQKRTRTPRRRPTRSE